MIDAPTEPLTYDDLTVLVDVTAAFSIWYQPKQKRGRWFGTTLVVPATLVAVSATHRDLVMIRREDTGERIGAVFDGPCRRGALRGHGDGISMHGWRHLDIVWLSLAAETPPAKYPADLRMIKTYAKPRRRSRARQ